MVRLGLAAVAAGCAFIPVANAAASVTLNGAGSTLVAPIEAEWASAWDSNTGNTVNFSAVGSGTGEKEVASGQVNFGASDAPLTAYANSSTPCSGCIQIPWALTATGVSYNVQGVGNGLKLTGGIIASIYLGKVHYWDDAAIQKINKGVNLPHEKIAVFWRSDGSGDSYAFTNFLSHASSTFGSQVGASTTPSFPTGAGAKGNSGMVTAVQNTPGAIAYIAVSYLINANLPAVQVYNRAHNYEYPNLNNIENAAQSVSTLPSCWKTCGIDITYPVSSARIAYPISTFTYAIAPASGLSQSQVRALKSFISYALHGGQQFAASLDFAKLPSNVLKAAVSQNNSIH